MCYVAYSAIRKEKTVTIALLNLCVFLVLPLGPIPSLNKQQCPSSTLCSASRHPMAAAIFIRSTLSRVETFGRAHGTEILVCSMLEAMVPDCTEGQKAGNEKERG